MTEFHAHSANGSGDWHGLVEHLQAVAEIAGNSPDLFAVAKPPTTPVSGMTWGSSTRSFNVICVGREAEARTTRPQEPSWLVNIWGLADC